MISDVLTAIVAFCECHFHRFHQNHVRKGDLLPLQRQTDDISGCLCLSSRYIPFFANYSIWQWKTTTFPMMHIITTVMLKVLSRDQGGDAYVKARGVCRNDQF